MEVKRRFRRRSSVGEFDTRKVQQKLESSHIAYDNMLGAGLEKRFGDDETNLKGSDEQHFKMH